MEEDNLNEIAKMIYSKEPGEPNSIQLELDELSDVSNHTDILYLLTYYGIRYLYGDDIQILEMTLEQYNVVKKYVRSYGYELIILGNDTNLDPWKLKSMGYNIYRYKIYFDNI